MIAEEMKGIISFLNIQIKGGEILKPNCTYFSPHVSGLYPGSMFDFSRRASSTASSIFDLSQEADQLEKAIKDDNINIVKKILEVHLNKFNMVNFHGSFQVLVLFCLTRLSS